MSRTISVKAATDQLVRLSGLRGFPAGENNPAFISLLDAMQAAPSLAAMERFVNDWLKENNVCPVPKSIYDAWRPPMPVSEWNTGCKICGGTGWIHFTKRVAIPGLAPYDADYAKRCECLINRITAQGGQV